jgi:hypothetical protein
VTSELSIVRCITPKSANRLETTTLRVWFNVLSSHNLHFVTSHPDFPRCPGVTQTVSHSSPTRFFAVAIRSLLQIGQDEPRGQNDLLIQTRQFVTSLPNVIPPQYAHCLPSCSHNSAPLLLSLAQAQLSFGSGLLRSAHPCLPLLARCGAVSDVPTRNCQVLASRGHIITPKAAHAKSWKR